MKGGSTITRTLSVVVTLGAFLLCAEFIAAGANVAQAEGSPRTLLADADLGDGLRVEIRTDGTQITASVVAPGIAPSAQATPGSAAVVATVPATQATGAQVEVFALSPGGARGAWARIDASPPVSVVLTVAKGQASVVWADHTGWRGESPRRERAVVSTEDRTGDGLRDIVIATEREDAVLCDGTTPWRSAVAWDTQTKKLRAVSIAPRIPEQAVHVVATPAPPGPAPTAAREFVEWTGATGGDLHALTDDNARTVWNPSGVPSDVGSFLLGRTLSDLIYLRAFEFDAPVIPGSWTGAERLLLRFSGGKSVVVALPTDSPTQAVSVSLPEPVATRCVSIEVLSLPRTTAPGAHVGFSAVRARTELDSDAGIGAALGRLASGDPLPAEGAAALAQVADAITRSAAGASLIAAWSATAPPDHARVAVASALAAAHGPVSAGAGGAADAVPLLAGAALGDAWSRARSFEDRWRVTALLGFLARTPAHAAWLRTLASESEHWMLRLAALRVLARDGGPAQAADLARHAGRDASPRVRAWAAELDALPTSDRAALAGKDAWAFVRAAATLGLPDGDALRARASDPSPRVRVAAFERAGDLRTASLSASAGTALRSAREEESVVTAAMRYAERTCRGELSAALIPWARGIARPSSGSRVELALTAIHALANLGTDEGKAALRALAGAGTDAATGQAARSGLESAPLCK